MNQTGRMCCRSSFPYQMKSIPIYTCGRKSYIEWLTDPDGVGMSNTWSILVPLLRCWWTMEPSRFLRPRRLWSLRFRRRLYLDPAILPLGCRRTLWWLQSQTTHCLCRQPRIVDALLDLMDLGSSQDRWSYVLSFLYRRVHLQQFCTECVNSWLEDSIEGRSSPRSRILCLRICHRSLWLGCCHRARWRMRWMDSTLPLDCKVVQLQ